MPRGPRILLLFALGACLAGASGCHLMLPEVSTQPVLHNPFPQLSRVAVAPFFNQSDDSTVDGRQFAMAYFGELQGVPGFEVVPVGVVEQAILHHAIDLSSPGEARRLARVLGVDAVVVGSVTDFSPYYPPRCGMRVEWYAANPGFHEIPAGYGLPWGTPDEEYIPESLVFEAEMALAKEQLATQTPDCNDLCETLPAPPVFKHPMQASPIPSSMPAHEAIRDEPHEMRGEDEEQEGEIEEGGSGSDGMEGASGAGDGAMPDDSMPGDSEAEALPAPPAGGSGASDANAVSEDDGMDHSASVTNGKIVRTQHEQPIAGAASGPMTAHGGVIDTTGAMQPRPVNWPDARGFTPPGPSPMRPECVPTLGPVMTHTRIYRGADPDFTAALASYVSFRDDARFGGWQSYLERSDDFIRFCAHLHLAELLTARGGGGETRVLHRWSESR